MSMSKQSATSAATENYILMTLLREWVINFIPIQMTIDELKKKRRQVTSDYTFNCDVIVRLQERKQMDC